MTGEFDLNNAIYVAGAIVLTLLRPSRHMSWQAFWLFLPLVNELDAFDMDIERR